MPQRILVGIVTSDKMNKSRVVQVPRSIRHPKYGKRMRARTTCYVHDEDGVSARGDTVEIQECPPRSKTKRWNLVRVVKKATSADVLEDAGLDNV